jgi:mercuric reductase
MKVEKELRRLKEILPIEEHQKKLTPELREVHRGILRSFAAFGRPLESAEIAPMVRSKTVSEVLALLAAKDLVVLDAKKERVVGAYPFTIEDTAHTVTITGHKTHAMCALDALSISPMFDTEVTIESCCHVSGTPVRIRQKQMEVLEAQPSREVQVGVRWQSAQGCAAHSLCMEMVFLRDPETSQRWLNVDPENKSIFTLPEAIEFGAGFFMPLVGGAPVGGTTR